MDGNLRAVDAARLANQIGDRRCAKFFRHIERRIVPHIERVRVGAKFQQYTGNLLELEGGGDVEVGSVPVVDGVDVRPGLEQGAAVVGMIQPNRVSQRREALFRHRLNVCPLGKE